jgi:hypothetical protein
MSHFKFRGPTIFLHAYDFSSRPFR